VLLQSFSPELPLVYEVKGRDLLGDFQRCGRLAFSLTGNRPLLAIWTFQEQSSEKIESSEDHCPDFTSAPKPDPWTRMPQILAE
jgi:hypothetical protein